MKKLWITLLCLILFAGAAVVGVRHIPWGYAREVSEQQMQRRAQIVQAAQGWLGCRESDGTHRAIVDLYNSHTPLARSYAVSYEDDWCSTFVSAVAIQCQMTDIIPTECGCEPQILLFQQLDAWQEDDGYVPLPGDCIFYHWDCGDPDDCDGWSDHVGIVEGTFGPFIKVIEGNKEDSVTHRITRVDAPHIRGYGIPQY